MSASINPTFLLKGVDPAKIIRDYNNGLYSRPPVAKSKIKLASARPTMAPQYGSNNRESIYAIRDKYNTNNIFVTSGHKDCEVYTKNGCKLPQGGFCPSCEKHYTHESVGYPIAMQENNIMCPVENVYKLTYVFWVEGAFCRFECALGFLRKNFSRYTNYQDQSTRDSEELLKFLYKLMYPNGPRLRPSQDVRLLERNGGSLNDDEWNDNSHVYVKTDRVLLLPMKSEYLQQNF